jgi:uncharacterized membrane protein (DUF4010 family)
MSDKSHALATEHFLNCSLRQIQAKKLYSGGSKRMAQTFLPFPAFDVATRILVAVACGLLVGLERQWANKELGSRTFPIVSLLGALAALISPTFEVAGFVGIVALIVVTAVRNLLLNGAAETTTSAALMATFALGVLSGEGHVFTPAAATILMTLMLALKPQLARFAVGLKGEEVRGAVLLALIGFVIYPLVPDRFVDPWQLFNPREIWLTIILISSIGFLNYILLRLFSVRGIYYTAIFGGLVNSTAAIAELTTLLRDSGEDAEAQALTVNLLTIVSMFTRNLALLAIFSPAAGLLALWPILAMACTSAVIVWRQKGASTTAFPSLQLKSPLELQKVTSFGLLFVFIQSAGSLGQRLLGSSGTVVVSIVGGLASSASSTAAAATLAAHGRISPREACLCTVLTSIASMLANLPVVYRQFRSRRLILRLFLLSGAIGLLGGGALAIEFLWPRLFS